MSRGRAFALVLVVRLTVGALYPADANPVMVGSAAGRFEIAAIDSTAAHGVAAVAEEGWRLLEGPLGLPAAFSSPVFVRLLPSAEQAGAGPFRVNVEPGGVVSVWLHASAGSEAVLRRALVRGLLSRLAVAQTGGIETPAVPRWLEEACAGWWATRAIGAQLDALKLQTARLSPPGIAALLDWPRGGAERPEFSGAAVWLLTFLQTESGPAGEWPAFLRRLLAGGDAQAALAACYPGRFFGTAARELWWQTGWHHARRIRVLPVIDAIESRAQLGALARFVFATGEGEVDVLVSLRAALARSGEPIVAAEVTRRAVELGRLIPALHPFYRNAGMALAEALGPGQKKAQRCDVLCAAFERDWRDAVELEEAASSALDALERTAGPPPGASAG